MVARLIALGALGTRWVRPVVKPHSSVVQSKTPAEALAAVAHSLSSAVDELVHSLPAVELQALPRTAVDDVRQSATCARTSQHALARCQMLSAAVPDSPAAFALLHTVPSSAES